MTIDQWGSVQEGAGGREREKIIGFNSVKAFKACVQQPYCKLRVNAVPLRFLHEEYLPRAFCTIFLVLKSDIGFGKRLKILIM